MTTTVQAQKHDGTITYDVTSTTKTRHEMIKEAVSTLFETGGVIKSGDTKYLVIAGSSFAVQDNEQAWVE